MNSKWLLALGLILGVALLEPANRAHADEIEAEEQAAKDMDKNANYQKVLREKYGLTEDQVTNMRQKGLSAPQMAIAAELAKSANKPLDEIIKMRSDDKKGWGKIANELGVPPGTIGQSVASLRHEIREHRQEGRQEAREARREARQEARETRRERRQQRREERREKHGQ